MAGRFGAAGFGLELPRRGYGPRWEADFTVGRGEGWQHLGGDQNPWKERMSGPYGLGIMTRQRRNATKANTLSRQD